MEQRVKYDVFISSKSDDYHLAEEVYGFLVAGGLSVFIASEELKKIGEAKYAEAIDEVLDNTIHMVVVASSLNHIKSKWVKYEWSTFSNDLKSGYRDGNLLTILGNDIELKTLPASLRHQQSFRLDSYRKEILDYLPICAAREEPKTHNTNSHIAVFKFYSNENCHITLDGRTIATLVGMSDEPYCLNVSRKGDYRFKCINAITNETMIRKEHVDANEEKEIDIQWGEYKPFPLDQERPESKGIRGETFVVELGGVMIEMCRVDGGSLQIGATSEQESDAEANEFPAHNINLSTFYIGKFPVTQKVWEAVMGYNKSYFKYKEDEVSDEPIIGKIGEAIGGLVLGGMCGLLGLSSAMMPLNKDDKTGKVIYERGHYPVENITFDEAQEFVRRLSIMTNLEFDLPSEEEWEYAARGGQKGRKCRYAGSENIGDVAWYRNNSERSTHPVGLKQPNELGIYDMCGNVWEWTKTPAHSYAVPVKPDGNVFIRRGGSWWHEQNNCRVSRRYASDRSKKTSGLGLRIVIRKNIE